MVRSALGVSERDIAKINIALVDAAAAIYDYTLYGVHALVQAPFTVISVTLRQSYLFLYSIPTPAYLWTLLTPAEKVEATVLLDFDDLHGELYTAIRDSYENEGYEVLTTTHEITHSPDSSSSNFVNSSMIHSKLATSPSPLPYEKGIPIIVHRAHSDVETLEIARFHS